MGELEYSFNDNFWNFVYSNINENPDKLRLKYHQSTQFDFDVQFAIVQIECRQRTAKKIPSTLVNKHFLFPTRLLSEQCTDEQIARLHASLFNGVQKVLDITAGLCIDSYHIANSGASVVALEIDEHAAKINALNMQTLNANVSVKHCDANDFLNQCEEQFDAIFADPARRNDGNNRVFAITHCRPDIVHLQPQFKRIANRLITKLSPMIDITDTLRILGNVTDIYVVGIRNECKEILVIQEFSRTTETVKVHSINYQAEGISEYISNFGTSQKPTFVFPNAEDFLYEPNACIMKSKQYDNVAEQFNLFAISANTHLHIGKEFIENYPGRRFRIESIITFGSKEAKSIKKQYPQINVSVRNFRLTPEQLKAKLGVKDGGTKYLFAITTSDSKSLLLICNKV